MLNTKKKLITIILVVAFAVVDVFSFSSIPVRGADSVDDIQDKLEELEKKKAAAEKELQVAQSQYWRNHTQINAAQSLINKLAGDISAKETELKNLNNRTELNRKMLAEYIRQMYYIDQESPLIKLSLWDGGLSDMSTASDGAINIKTKIMAVLDDIDAAKGRTLQAQADLSEKKQDNQEVLQDKKVEQGAVLADVQDKQATLADIQQKLAELQDDLSKITGVSYNAKDICDAVDFASKKRNVPKGVLYGFLGAETHFNANTGTRTYSEMEASAVAAYKKYSQRTGWNPSKSIKLLGDRKELFYNIVDSLGYSHNKKVSNVIIPANFSNYSPNQGGAMGVAQFMSEVWGGWDGKSGYIPDIRRYTGHAKPDPWNITDGVMAMAIKISNAGGTSDSKAAIRKASINYYGAYSPGYYNNVLYWSVNYKSICP